MIGGAIDKVVGVVVLVQLAVLPLAGILLFLSSFFFFFFILVNPRSPPCKLLSTIPYVGGRKMRCMFAGSYLGGTQWSKLAVLRWDLYVRRQRMRRNDLQHGERERER